MITNFPTITDFYMNYEWSLLCYLPRVKKLAQLQWNNFNIKEVCCNSSVPIYFIFDLYAAGNGSKSELS